MGGTDPAVLGVPCHPVPSRPVGEVVLEAARGVRHRGAGGSVRGTLLCTNVRVAFVPGAQVGTSPHRDPPSPSPGPTPAHRGPIPAASSPHAARTLSSRLRPDRAPAASPSPSARVLIPSRTHPCSIPDPSASLSPSDRVPFSSHPSCILTPNCPHPDPKRLHLTLSHLHPSPSPAAFLSPSTCVLMSPQPHPCSIPVHPSCILTPTICIHPGPAASQSPSAHVLVPSWIHPAPIQNPSVPHPSCILTPIYPYLYPVGADRKAGEELLIRARGDWVRGNGFKLEEERSRLDISIYTLL